MAWMKYLLDAALAAATAGAVSILVVRPNPSGNAPPKTMPSNIVHNVPESDYIEQEAAETTPRNRVEALPAPSAVAQVAESTPLVPHTEAEVATEFESGFATDGPATRDARQAETLLRSAFADPGLSGTRLKQAECRATLCRAEILFDNEEADRAAFKRLMNPDSPLTQELGQMGAIVPERKVAPDGTIVAMLYLYAPGADPTRALSL